MTKAFAVDLDGVVCNWARAFSELCNEIDDRAPVITDNACPAWRWQTWYWDAGPKAKAIIEEAWKLIKTALPTFWENVDPLFPDAMPLLAEMSDTQPLIFITRRDGPEVWKQTTNWLRRYGVREPLVYCVKSGEEKSEVMDKLGLDLIIEDSPVYVVKDLLPAGKQVILIDWLYNQGVWGDNLIRVRDLKTALELGKGIHS